MRRTALLFALLGACSPSESCPDAAPPAPDAFAVDAGTIDADVVDAAVVEDCVATAPTLTIAPVLLAHAPDTLEWWGAAGETRPAHVEIYAEGSTAPAIVRDGLAPDAQILGELSPGTYRIAMRVGAYAVGGAELGLPECEGSSSPRCMPRYVRVRGCRMVGAPVVLYCDPADAACASASWPWPVR